MGICETWERSKVRTIFSSGKIQMCIWNVIKFCSDCGNFKAKTWLGKTHLNFFRRPPTLAPVNVRHLKEWRSCNALYSYFSFLVFLFLRKKDCHCAFQLMWVFLHMHVTSFLSDRSFSLNCWYTPPTSIPKSYDCNWKMRLHQTLNVTIHIT